MCVGGRREEGGGKEKEEEEEGEEVCVWVVVGMGRRFGPCVRRVCLSIRTDDACTEFGWQSEWEQAPGVPATHSPPWWRGSTLAVYLCTRP